MTLNTSRQEKQSESHVNIASQESRRAFAKALNEAFCPITTPLREIGDLSFLKARVDLNESAIRPEQSVKSLESDVKVDDEAEGDVFLYLVHVFKTWLSRQKLNINRTTPRTVAIQALRSIGSPPFTRAELRENLLAFAIAYSEAMADYCDRELDMVKSAEAHSDETEAIANAATEPNHVDVAFLLAHSLSQASTVLGRLRLSVEQHQSEWSTVLTMGGEWPTEDRTSTGIVVYLLHQLGGCRIGEIATYLNLGSEAIEDMYAVTSFELKQLIR